MQILKTRKYYSDNCIKLYNSSDQFGSIIHALNALMITIIHLLTINVSRTWAGEIIDD